MEWGDTTFHEFFYAPAVYQPVYQNVKMVYQNGIPVYQILQIGIPTPIDWYTV